ncbi:MAG: amidohydrolase [Coriobacteriales bacterium]|jgi:5-methylthioadenosine/S-adenosylhomocysteine deaminase|nr:amidohydrolase [Coriobacteriales bacterium]
MNTLFTNIDYLSSEFTLEQGFVLVEGTTISYLGPDDPRKSVGFDHKNVQEIPGKGRLMVPGFYNIHTHIPMTLLRGYAEGLPLQQWLNTKIFPFEALMTPQMALPASELAIAEMLRFGTVSFSDMYDFTHERAEAVRTSGIKANLSYGAIAFDPEERYENTPRKAEVASLAQTYHNTCDGRLKFDVFVHSEYLSNPYVVQAVGQQARELGINTHIHLSETAREHEEAKARRGGLTPTQYFDSLEFFAQPCTAAHAVWTEPEDWQLLAERGVSVAHNPCSNAKLGSGIMPLCGMMAAGVNVGLATDGMASNNNHNLFKELYLASLLAKASTLDAASVSVPEALALATINGARSQGRNQAGSLKAGAAADLVLLDTTGPWMHPAHDRLNNLVFSAQGSDVCLTMVDGKVLFSNGEWKTIDVERTIALTSKATRDIVSAL